MILIIVLISLIFVVFWLLLFRYLVPRFYLVVGESMYPTIMEGDVVMGLKLHPSVPLIKGGVYGYRLPWDMKKWSIKRLSYFVNDKCFFVGDNSDNSIDSREYGFINRENVMFEVVWHKNMQGG